MLLLDVGAEEKVQKNAGELTPFLRTVAFERVLGGAEIFVGIGALGQDTKGALGFFCSIREVKI